MRLLYMQPRASHALIARFFFALPLQSPSHSSIHSRTATSNNRTHHAVSMLHRAHTPAQTAHPSPSPSPTQTHQRHLSNVHHYRPQCQRSYNPSSIPEPPPITPTLLAAPRSRACRSHGQVLHKANCETPVSPAHPARTGSPTIRACLQHAP